MSHQIKQEWTAPEKGKGCHFQNSEAVNPQISRLQHGSDPFAQTEDYKLLNSNLTLQLVNYLLVSSNQKSITLD